MTDAGEHSAGPLRGVRVLDFTHVLSGPYCTSLLVDAGAEVVKVEPPSADIARVRGLIRTGPDNQRLSVYAAAVSRGKRSMVLDLKDSRGLEVAIELARVADIVVENFAPGVMRRLGLDLAKLRELNPRLITASIHLDARHGESGSVRRGLAVVSEAESGLLRTRTSAAGIEGAPQELGFLLGDFLAGLTAYSAIVTSLAARGVTGAGAHHNIGMLQSLLPLNVVDILTEQFIGDSGASNPRPSAGYGLFATSDGWIAIGVNSDVLWGRLAGAMARPDLGEKSGFAGYAVRDRNRDYLNEIVAAWAGSLPASVACSALSEAGVPCGKVNTAGDLLSGPAGGADPGDLFDVVDDGLGGQLRLPRNSMGFARAPGTYAPVGRDTREVLSDWLGMPSEDFRQLASAHVFGSLS
jgi:CoA:oxalate CoA-transferase